MEQALALDRRTLIARAFRLEWATIGWMTVEAAVSIAAAIAAGSLSLLAFGLDSAIELISAGVLIWRLSVELRHGAEFSESAERLASRIGGALLFALAFYVVASAAWSLMDAGGARNSPFPVSRLPRRRSRSCIGSPGASSRWPRRSAAGRCAPMRSRASPAAIWRRRS